MKIFAKGFNFNQDGPGNRLVYHLSGCNMHCPWCSNPEGMSATTGKLYTVEQAVEECKSCRPMFFGGGGVTFTGGEATLQVDELIQVLQRLQSEGIHTAIETNGTAERLPEIAAYVDYLIMDFKHPNSHKLQQITGIGNERIKHNFEYFDKTEDNCMFAFHSSTTSIQKTHGPLRRISLNMILKTSDSNSCSITNTAKISGKPHIL